MIKAIGFLGSLSGDIVMCSAMAKAFKTQFGPESHLTFACAKQFGSILPLFYDNKYIDNYHIWDGYNDWPTNIDKHYINHGKFNIVFDCLPSHTSRDWYNHYHYIEETALMLGLQKPQDLKCYLNPWFGKDSAYSNYVAISAFPSKSAQLNKTLSLNTWNFIVKEINKMGFKCVQLGGKYDIQIEGAEKPDLDWIGAAKVLHSSKLQITTDTSWAWIGSAYEHNAIGLYGLNYPDMRTPNSHLPVNDNATYLYGKDVSEIHIDTLLDIIRERLK